MARFETVDGTSFKSTVHGDKRLTIPLGKSVDIYLRGTDSAGRHLTIKPALKQFIEVVKTVRISAEKQLVTIKGKAAGWEKLAAFDAAGNSQAMVKIITGVLKPHNGMVHDLLYEKLANSGDSKLMHLLRQILENQVGNTFNQHSDENVERFDSDLACGQVVEANWNDLGLNKTFIDLVAYHNKLAGRVSSKNQVTYKAATLTSGRNSIKRLLSTGTPVRVGVMLRAEQMTVINGDLIAYHHGGHYVLIVGCNANADEFLYIDPYPGGSKLKYTGGAKDFDTYEEHCEHLGLFTYKQDLTNRIPGRRHLIIQHPDTNGFGSELIRGPK